MKLLFALSHKKRSYHLMPLNLLQLHILFKMNTLSSILIYPREILIMMMMCLLVHIKAKHVLAENFNVLTLIHAMKSHTQIFQKLFKSLRRMSLMPQSLKDSTRKVT